jgi:hypothetical protein
MPFQGLQEGGCATPVTCPKPSEGTLRSAQRVTAALLLLITFTSRGLAQFDTGNHLLTECLSENFYDKGYCLGYITAIADQVGISSTTCFTEQVTRSQVRDVAIRYLQSAPQLRHLPASNLVAVALTQAFPCAR